MDKKTKWAVFDNWFDKRGHWMFGIDGKTKAELAWKTNGIDGLPTYPGDRDMNMTSDNCKFDAWWDELNQIAYASGGVATDKFAWFNDYKAGKTPRRAWMDGV